MKIKLFTLWVGDLPPWIDRFRDRAAACKSIDWDLLHFSTVHELNRTLSVRLPAQSFTKATAYAAGDYRPILFSAFPELVGDTDWWGWVDLDVIVGDLDRLLPPTLAECDVLRVDGGGPLTMLKTSIGPLLWRAVPPNTPDYTNFDEDGFGSPRNRSFENLLKNIGIRVRHDGRWWTETKETMRGGAPSRSCEFRDGKLFEVPTGRELLLYHFTMPPKTWPVPNRWEPFLAEQREFKADTNSVRNEESPAFWTDRLSRVLKVEGSLHKVVFDCDENDWEAVQWHTAGVLRQHVCEGSKVLDAGCGPGLLYPCFAMAGKRVTYHGVDYCEDMIRYAKSRHPELQFTHADLRRLPFKDNEFHVVVCRSVEGSVKTLVSLDDWDRMQSEMLRVAPRLILIDMNFHHRVVER